MAEQKSRRRAKERVKAKGKSKRQKAKVNQPVRQFLTIIYN
jgi:hypothetical protein